MRQLYLILIILISFNITGFSVDNKLCESFQINQNIDSIKIEIKGNPKIIKIDNKYWIKITHTKIDKKKIVVSSNNGKLFKSQDQDFDYMFIPSKSGKLKLKFYEEKNGKMNEFFNFDLLIEN